VGPVVHVGVRFAGMAPECVVLERSEVIHFVVDVCLPALQANCFGVIRSSFHPLCF
jgi:hypothetical protein